ALSFVSTTFCHSCSRKDYFAEGIVKFSCTLDEYFFQNKPNTTKQDQARHISEELQPTNNEPPIAPFEDWAILKIQEQTKIKSSTDHKISAQNVQNNQQSTHNEQENSKSSRNYAKKELDEYMLNPCQTEKPKFFVVELCESVQISHFELANFELFSSNFKDFRLYAAERYPSPDWLFLGQFKAQDSRQIHRFAIDNQKIYAKYIKVELLSNYGDEHFCSLTLIRVSGVSMVEDYENEAAAAAVLTPTLDEQQISSNIQANDSILNDTLQSLDTKIHQSATSEVVPSSANSTQNLTTQPPETVGKDYLETAKLAVLSVAKGVYGKVFNTAVKESDVGISQEHEDSISKGILLLNTTKNSTKFNLTNPIEKNETCNEHDFWLGFQLRSSIHANISNETKTIVEENIFHSIQDFSLKNYE
uniref:SUN domain-containing protein n=1 Tax=Romanomermis culicivorax TaxID=13658 RepID=A0A915L981_ROMCU